MMSCMTYLHETTFYGKKLKNHFFPKKRKHNFGEFLEFGVNLRMIHVFISGKNRKSFVKNDFAFLPGRIRVRSQKKNSCYCLFIDVIKQPSTANH